MAFIPRISTSSKRRESVTATALTSSRSRGSRERTIIQEAKFPTELKVHLTVPRTSSFVVYFRNSRVALLSSTMVRSFHIPLVLFPKFSMDTSALQLDGIRFGSCGGFLGGKRSGCFVPSRVLRLHAPRSSVSRKK